jgi:hypothetical protein
MPFRGEVKNGVVIFQNSSAVPLPDGTLVEVTPLPSEAGNSVAVIVAMKGEPHLSQEDVAKVERAIGAGKRPTAAIDPFPEDTLKSI